MVALNRYSALDRLVHRIAFATPNVQHAAAEIESSLFRRELEKVEIGPPVFVTSLPRAGTTLLLTALNASPELAAHLYRDMPFVMAPLLWARLSAPFQRKAVMSERAHGDGVTVGYDSPEAFDEVIWRAFWPEHFKPEGISLWSADEAQDAARDFMARHIRKLVILRCKGGTRPGRYLSKNNANIARIEPIRSMFPDAHIVVPVREPMSQAASMHRQHLNFLKRHAADPFARRYMRDIGHYEFGALHRPILFEGFAALAKGLSPSHLDYWIAYWIAAFEHVSRHREQVLIVGYEDLCRRGEDAGRQLCDLLGLDSSSAPDIGARFRPPPQPPEFEAHSATLRERAESLHRQLVRR